MTLNPVLSQSSALPPQTIQLLYSQLSHSGLTQSSKAVVIAHLGRAAPSPEQHLAAVAQLESPAQTWARSWALLRALFCCSRDGKAAAACWCESAPKWFFLSGFPGSWKKGARFPASCSVHVCSHVCSDVSSDVWGVLCSQVCSLPGEKPKQSPHTSPPAQVKALSCHNRPQTICRRHK